MRLQKLLCGTVIALSSLTLAAFGTSSSLPIPGLGPWFQNNKLEDRIGYISQAIYEGQHMGTSITDSFPFLFQNQRNKSQSALICLLQKTGSTKWKSLLLKHLNNTYFAEALKSKPGGGSTVRDVHRQAQNLPCVSLEDYQRAMQYDSKIPRIFIVRNPYERLLSGYLDKVVKPDMKEVTALGGFENYYNAYQLPLSLNTSVQANPVATFLQFLRYINNVQQHVDGHWMSQSKSCFLQYGMKYDYFLHVEHMAQWYSPLVQYLGLEKEVDTGWNFQTEWHHGAEDCFYHKPGERCAPINRSSTNQKISLMMNDSDAADNLLEGDTHPPDHAAEEPHVKRSHDMHTETQIAKYYSSHTALIVNEFAGRDLKVFRYPKWDGKNATELFQHLSYASFVYNYLGTSSSERQSSGTLLGGQKQISARNKVKATDTSASKVAGALFVRRAPPPATAH